MTNKVEILVVTKDQTRDGFSHASAGAFAFGNVIADVVEGAVTKLAEVGVASIKMASSFEAQMERLHTQAHVAQDQIKGLSDGVLKLAGQVGADPNSLAEALYHIESNFASVGITSSRAMEMLKVAAQGARIGGADLVDVTNALTAAVAANIPGVKDLNQAMGVLNATVGAGDMTMQDLAAAFGTGMVATVKGYGLSIKDVGAALAVFGDNNIRGAKAGTQLRMAVQSLAVPAQTAGAWLDKFGMTTDTLAKDMQQKGLLYALTDLKTRMEKAGISAVEQGQVITDMFGKKAGTGVNILIDQLDRLKSKYPELDRGAGEFADAWAKTTETFQQKWAQLTNFMKARMIQVGLWLIPQLESWAAAIGRLWQGTPATAGATAGEARAAGSGGPGQSRDSHPEAGTAATASGGRRGWGAAFSDMWASAKRFLPEVKKLWNDLVGAMKTLWDRFYPVIAAAFKEWTAKSKDFFKAIKDNWPEIKLILEALAAVILAVIVVIFKIAGAWAEVYGVIVQVVGRIVDLVVMVASAIAGAFASAFGWIPGIGPKFKAAAEAVEKYAKKMTDSINNIPDYKAITLQFNAVTTVYDSETGRVVKPGMGSSRIGGLAAGGIVGAASGMIASGLTWVGEHGRELVRLPVGSSVHSNPDSERMASVGTPHSGTQRVQIEFVGNTDSAFATAFMRLQRHGLIKIRSANVVTA